MKGKFRKTLAVFLAVAMLLAGIPVSALAAEKAAVVKIEDEVISDDVHALNFKAQVGTAVGKLANLVVAFSYDKAAIIPVDAASKADIAEETQATILTAMAKGQLDPITPEVYPDQEGNRTTVVVTYFTTSPIDANTMVTGGKFYYRIKDESKMAKGTIKLDPGENVENAIVVSVMNSEGDIPEYSYNNASEDTVTLESFTYPGSDKQSLKTLTLASAGDATSVAVPKKLGTGATTTSATLGLTATALDTDDEEMATFPSVTWSVTPDLEGVTISGTGAKATLTVAPGAESGTATVKVVSGSVEATKAIEITRDKDAPAAVKIFSGDTEITGDTDTIVIPPQSATAANTKTYTAKAYNQYGEEMKDAASLAFETADANVTYSDGTVSVAKGATKGATYTLTATATADSKVSKAITIKLTDLEVNWTAVDNAMKNTMVYGTANSGAATNLPATGTATAGTTLNGSFAIKNPTAIQTVGDKTVTVVFTVTSTGDYKNITVEKDYTVEVTKKPVTVRADNKSRTYGAANPEFTLTVPNGTLVGEDKEIALGVTLACAAEDYDDSPAGTPVDITGTSKSDNYDVTVTPGKLTITKANIIMAGYPEKNEQGELVLKDSLKYTDLANSPSNTYENMITNVGGFKDPDNPLDFISILFDNGTEEGGKTNVEVKWTGPVEKFNPKGGTYTYTAAVVPGTNFNAYRKTTKVVVEIQPITGTLVTPLTTPVVIAKSAASNATSYADFKLPASISITYNDGEEDVTQTITPTWSVPLNTLKAKGVNTTTAVEAKLPEEFEWLTVDKKALTVDVKITDKFPVNVTLTQANGTYGTELAAPVAEQTAIDDGIDSKGTFTYKYTGKTAAGKTYNSADKPTEAGDYTVTATLVSDTHAGSKSVDFKIAPKALAAGMIADIPAETYNKEAHEPVVTVTDGTTPLVLDTDYTVAYESNVNAGTAKAIVTGKWNYTGEVSKDFTINKASLAELTPTISGTAQVGKVLTANLEDVADSELTYQWKRGGTDIPGAAGKTYLLAADDSNKEITVVLTAANPGNYTGTTKPSEGVTVEKQAISGTVTITETNGATGTAGTIDNGDTLKAETAGITPTTTFTYQWYRGEEAIESATEATYTVTTDDADQTLKVVVTATGDFQGEVEASVEVGKTVLTGKPTISGASSPAAAVGDELTVAYGTGTEGEDYTVVWLRDGEPISGAEGTTYTLTDEDQGKTISAKVVGKGDYTGEVVSDGTTVPATAPATPELKLSAKNKAINASWTKPADHGATILSYTLTITDGKGYTETVTVSPDDTSYGFTDLTNGTEYTVTLKATNTVGDSEVSTKTAKPKSSGGVGGGAPTTTEPVVSSGMDGSTVSTLTEDDGTVTTTTTWPDGKESVSTVTPAGDVSILVKNENGETTAEVTIPSVVPDTGKTFEDVKTSDWFQENVYKTTNLGLFSGTSDTTFEPKTNLNRGMLVTVLYNMSGKPTFGTDVNVFPDITGEEWYAPAADWAKATGVAAGTDKGFEPTQDITRQDMVTMIYQYAKTIGLNPVESASLSKFKDGAKTSDYAQPAMKWAVSVGIVSGKGEGILDPKGNATRAEVASVLANFLKYLQK